MADDTICMETHITRVKFTKVCGGGGRGADSVDSHNTCSKLIRVYIMVAVAMHFTMADSICTDNPPVCTSPITTRGLCSRSMKVCGGGAFTMADDTICMESHNTCSGPSLVEISVADSERSAMVLQSCRLMTFSAGTFTKHAAGP